MAILVGHVEMKYLVTTGMADGVCVGGGGGGGEQMQADRNDEQRNGAVAS